jgi:hypothetical protein
MMPGNEAVLGLKVYTSKSAGTKIEGQLRYDSSPRRMNGSCLNVTHSFEGMGFSSVAVYGGT